MANDGKQSYPICRLQLGVETLNNLLNESTNENWIKVPKVHETTNKKTLGTSVINSPMPYPPPSLGSEGEGEIYAVVIISSFKHLIIW